MDIHLKSSIEGVVIKWANQISQVLSEDPTTVFTADCNPEPKAGEYSVQPQPACPAART